ncbi:HAD-IIIA family hydrolase [Rhizobium sp. NZLR1b]|uniref:HAD-IIIA family hydrolase n=1 Tax=unclassified Rhizobium TaxID=2613769 RepID=UPI001C839259|nr:MULTISPECIES: HAD-IIIA family hydrolase [unclassified Rhizobium]MBX5168405.1 HAD-IIIA family hydrolase [Rhizobium sp. NZLR1b]MBX5187671.1 HAD-IIIA family hydrolase [Rhizobium sp. NZLR3b]
MGSEDTIRQAIIIAGGLGTRARSMTGDAIPKALLPLAGVPIILRQIRILAREGVQHVRVLGGHLGSQLEPALAPEAEKLGIKVEVFVEKSPLGTAGCLTTLDTMAGDVLIVYGDMLFDIDLSALARHRRQFPAALTIIAHPNDHPRTSDLVVQKNGYLQRLLPRKTPRDSDWRNLVPAGLYVASEQFFQALFPGQTADMIHDVIPGLLERSVPIAIYDTPEYMKDTGSPNRHAAAEDDLRQERVHAAHLSVRRPAVFFDCDGVLNEDVGGHGVIHPDQVKLIDRAGEAVQLARDAGFLTVAVTNRPQVAKGFLDEPGLDHVLGRLEAELAEEGGVLDRIYFCPHHPDKGFPREVAALKIDCACRKPGDLMIRQAMTELPIEKEKSVIIGDSLRDIGAGRKAGIWAYGVRTGYGLRDGKSYPAAEADIPRADLIFDTVYDAVRFQCSYQDIGHELSGAIHQRLSNGAGPLLVGICGRSRSGKSTLAHAVERLLSEAGRRVARLELDRWILPLEHRRPDMNAEERNRVELYPEIISMLRQSGRVEAPGYEAASRSQRKHTTIYDAREADVILLDGIFAGHASIRDDVDMAVFVEASQQTLLNRFHKFYAWKGLTPASAEGLWVSRIQEEWPKIDLQRAAADIVINFEEAIL